jgi:ubiquinone biosynthesis protein
MGFDRRVLAETILRYFMQQMLMDGRYHADPHPGFERALARFMARHLGPGAVPSAAMFNDLLKVLFAFSISLPAEFSTFFRALVTLEGTLTTLSPGFAVVQAAQDIGGEWARARLAPESLADFARDEALHLAPLLRRLPRQLDRLATMGPAATSGPRSACCRSRATCASSRSS